jgi:hypothetical protein
MTLTTLDWDAYRNAYHTLTYEQHQDFHSAIYEQYPEQRHYDHAQAVRAIETIRPTTVVELGGWDGELASAMLTHDPDIKQWTNIELCREAAAKGYARYPRYHAPILDGWYWDHGPWHADLFVASHTIEHLNAYHLDRTIAATRADAFYFDAPLEDHPLSWAGSTTSHILGMGWTGIHNLMHQYGYTILYQQDHDTPPETGGHARAVLYTKEPQA